MSRYFDPKNDLVFKKIFGEHPHLLISFLNAMMNFEDGSVIESIEYLKDELLPDTPLKMRSVVDVRCKDNKGRQFIVEMQMEWVDAFMDRMLSNVAKIYGTQVRRGGKYIELQPVYGLAIVNEIFDRETEEYYHLYVMQNPKQPKERLKGISLIFIELPKFTPKSRAEKELAVLWLRFLKEIGEETQQVPSELTANRDINEAIEICEVAAYSEEEQRRYEKYWDRVRYENTLLHEKFREGAEEGLKEGIERGLEKGLKKGKTEGKKEGLAEGEKKKETEFIINAYQNGISIEQIAKIVQLSVENITEILRQNGINT